MASFTKDLKKVFAEIRDQDPEVEISQSRNGHWRVVPGDKSKQLVHLGGTPSDHRAWLNIIKQLERSCGYDLSRFRR